MTNATTPILVIGATGKIGGRIMKKLAAIDVPARAASRSSSPAFDWDEPATWAPVLAGARVAYVAYVPDLAEDGAPERLGAFAELAKAQGVERVVLVSGRGEHNAKRSEAMVRQSGLGVTCLRAAWFSQNFSEGHLYDQVMGGVVAVPAGDVREAFVDTDDIADVAVATLTDPRHVGEIYNLSGPRLLTFAEAAGEIAAAAGFPVTYVPITVDELYEAVLAEAGERMANVLRIVCSETLDGRNEYLGDGVQRVLGRQPRDFRDYVREAAASGAWSARAAAE